MKPRRRRRVPGRRLRPAEGCRLARPRRHYRNHRDQDRRRRRPIDRACPGSTSGVRRAASLSHAHDVGLGGGDAHERGGRSRGPPGEATAVAAGEAGGPVAIGGDRGDTERAWLLLSVCVGGGEFDNTRLGAELNSALRLPAVPVCRAWATPSKSSPTPLANSATPSAGLAPVVRPRECARKGS